MSLLRAIAQRSSRCSIMPEGLTFIDLQLWCKNIAQTSTYSQYEAEVYSHATIATMGDIHDVADGIVWFPPEDCGAVAYPFEMLNNKEYAEVAECGALLYKRTQHTLMNQAAMPRLLLNTKSLPIIEAEKSNGKKVCPAAHICSGLMYASISLQICKAETMHRGPRVSGSLKHVNHHLIRKIHKTPSSSLGKKERELTSFAVPSPIVQNLYCMKYYQICI